MKKLLLLCLAMAGLVSTASATTKTIRIYTERQYYEGWGNDVYIIADYWNGAEDVPIVEKQQMTPLTASSGGYMFYTDVTLNVENVEDAMSDTNYGVKFKFTNNSGTDAYRYELKDASFFSHNHIFYIKKGNDFWTDHGTFTYKFAKLGNESSISDIVEVAPVDNVINYTVNHQTTSGEDKYVLYPSFAASDSNINYWDLTIRPKTDSGDFEISNFQYYSDDIQLGGANGVFYVKLDTKIDFTFNLLTMKWSAVPYYTRTIGEAGYITWSNDEKYKVSGATPYTVEDKGTYAKLNAVDNPTGVFPAASGTAYGIVLNGSENDEVTFSAVASDAEVTADITTNNDLRGSGNSSASIGADCYVLYWNGTSAGFQITGTGSILAAHKAYLPAASEGSRSFLAFNEEITGINEVTTTTDNGVIFNLQGVRLNKMQKGLNVVNGKKVMVK